MIFIYVLLGVLLFAVLVWLIVILYMRQPKFGAAPKGRRLERIGASPNFKDGQFQNQNITPQLVEGYSIAGIIYKQFFKKHPRRRPSVALPVIKTDLKGLSRSDDLLIWFGHSSYFLQIDGVRFLVDPVFSGNASPIPGTNPAFRGTNIYSADGMPDIDQLVITHDHYDHLDHETVVGLKGKVANVICALGVGAHLEHWGYESGRIVEMDWYENVRLDNGFVVHCLPSRHFAGRGFSRNNTLWCSFLLEWSSMKIYIGGDSGYDKHFSEIGKNFGGVDLALLDNGQYNEAWRYIHALPDEVVQAAKDLRAKKLFPVHSAKFAMANHAWDEPLMRVSALGAEAGLDLLTPVMGEVVLLDAVRGFEKWWEGVE